ncbi:hypothetical protein ACHQM5_001992 [Ranunculus cassubicifolius]
MKEAGKIGKMTGKRGQQEGKKDRKSGSGMSGSPKKGGHGGKFTWAGVGYSNVEIGLENEKALDVKDPNFEDPADEDVAM